MATLHSLQKLLIDLEISSENSFIPFHSSTRDRKDIAVLRCSRSGVITLSRTDHMDITYYEKLDSIGEFTTEQREQAIEEFRKDDERRARFILPFVTNKRWIDVGTETGGILRLLRSAALEAIGVEPKNDARELVSKDGFKTYPLLKDVERTDIDVITLFHVFEHLTQPLEVLKEAFAVLSPGGRLVLEVPHANDILINLLDLKSFKDFTFWSEHLILHTRNSLRRFVDVAGFTDIVITGIQRYPLSNHLYWLRKQAPGGHKLWSMLDTPELTSSYESMLQGIDQTDTLLLTCTKPRE
jgi:SAM-dependent methyltransferase